MDTHDPILTTIASYEAKADEYIHKTDQLAYFPGLPAMLDRFISLLPGHKVLDVAFGAGRDTLYFIEQGLDVEGIELTQAFINALCLKADIPLYKMDMRRLGFTDDAFDGIWCCASFLHLPHTDALATLREFARVLRPAGILYLDLKEGDGEEWVIDSDGNVSNATRYYTYYGIDEICQLLTKADFEVLFTRRQEHIKPNEPFWINLICRKPA
jgi:ubiquinone/menaquinone biosynthesis C-methylase UbiE